MKQIKALQLILFLIITCALVSQNTVEFEYTYDNAGNRTTRTVINLKNQNIANTNTDSTIIANETIDFLDSPNENDIVNSIIGDKNLESTNIDVFPNPVKEYLYIEISGYSSLQNSYWQIIDANGRVIKNKDINNSNSTIDFSKFLPGTYFVRIHISDEFKEFKIIKQ